MDEDPKQLMDGLIGANPAPHSKGPKDPKGSARQKYNRRKTWLASSLHQMEIAIDDLLRQDGPVYKRQEIETLRQAIRDFIATTGLIPPELEPPTPEEMDAFIDMLSNLKPWEPPSEEVMAALRASIDEVADHDDDRDDQSPEPTDRD